ncbi:MAG: hypothetical protein AAFO94_13745, partial [Bacteroidota bacterium]
ANVTVLDDQAPIPVCQDVILPLSASGFAVLDPAMADNGTFDNCSFAAFADQTTFDCNNLGSFPFFIQFFDDSQNMAECEITLTIIDNESPVIDCQDIAISVGADGFVQLAVEELYSGAFDNCGEPTITADRSTFSCNDAGINIITLTAIDNSGNLSTCTSTVEILTDDPAPTVLEQVTCDPTLAGTFVDTLSNQIGCDSIIVTEVLYFGADTTSIENTTCDQSKAGTVTELFQNVDGCDSLVIINTTYLPNGDTTVVEMFTCIQNEVGVSHEVFTDAEGCDSVVATVKIFGDDESPVAVCRDFALSLNPNGIADLFTQDIDGGSSDACGSVFLDLDAFQFTCEDLGTNVVTLFVTDDFGNMATCSAIVSVEDNESPTLSCQDVVVMLDESGTGSLVIDEAIVNVGDNCQFVDISASQTEFNCTETGLNVISLTAFDNSGNTSSCDVTVEVMQSQSAATYVDIPTCDQSEAGESTEVFTNQFGCDSTVITLVYYNPIADTITIDSFTCIAAEAGTFYREEPRADGCFDLIETIVVFDNTNEPIFQQQFTCDSLAQGIFTEVITDAAGCDQEVVTEVIWVGPITPTIVEVFTCIESEAGTSTTEVLTDQTILIS